MLQIVPLPDSRKDQSRRRHRSRVVDLPPELFDAMTALAQVENLPLRTLIVLLINSCLSARIARTRGWS
jgi:hypothetical protein